MTDKKFVVGVIAFSAAALAGVVTLYVWLNTMEEERLPGYIRTERAAPASAGPQANGSPTTLADLAVVIYEQRGRPVEFEPTLHPVRVGGRYGFIDDAGQIVIKPQFSRVEQFSTDSEGRETAAVMVGRAWGVIDTMGHWVEHPKLPSPPERNLPTGLSAGQFEARRPFSEGFAAARKAGKWGFIDQHGLWAAEPVYDHVGDFRGSHAAVWIGRHMGFIDIMCRLAVEPRFEMTVEQARFSEFSASMAAVLIDGSWGYIDRRGQVVIAPRFQAARPFSALAPVKLAGKWGFIDRNGRISIEPTFADVDPADCGDGVYRGGFRPAGRWRHENEPSDAKWTALAPAATDAGWGFIGVDGRFVIPPQYKHVGPFRGPLARIITDAGEGYIDKDGNVVFAPSK